MKLHRTLDGVDAPAVPLVPINPDFRVALGSGVLACGGLIVAGGFGDIHSHVLHQRVLAAVGAVAFLAFAAVAVRRTGNELFRVLKPRAGDGHSAVIRLLVNLVGYTIVVFTALGLLAVPVQHLLLGGALTGVFVGIAAQQPLGNLFAGLVLLLARPFNIGDHVVLRSGAFAGPLNGQVTGMGLIYVTLLTEKGPLSLPNSAVLAAGIGPQVDGDGEAPAPTAMPAPSAAPAPTAPGPRSH